MEISEFQARRKLGLHEDMAKTLSEERLAGQFSPQKRARRAHALEEIQNIFIPRYSSILDQFAR